MKYIRQFGIIAVISFIGEMLHEVISFPVPASIYGIVLLFCGLLSGVIRLEDVHDAGHFLVDIMPLCFIAPLVGLMDSWQLLTDNLVPYLLIPFISTVIIMGCTGRVTQAMLRLTQKRRQSREEAKSDE